MAERKSIYFPDEIWADLQLRVGPQRYKTSGAVTAALGWYFRWLGWVGVSEMDGFFTLAEVRALAAVAGGMDVELGSLDSVRLALVVGLKNSVLVDLAPLVRKIQGLSPNGLIWLWDRLTILVAHAASPLGEERVAAMFRVEGDMCNE